jgi:hypothetical protein
MYFTDRIIQDSETDFQLLVIEYFPVSNSSIL